MSDSGYPPAGDGRRSPGQRPHESEPGAAQAELRRVAQDPETLRPDAGPPAGSADRTGTLEQEMRGVRDQLRKLERVPGELRDLAATVGKLETLARWLEQRARRTAGADAATFEPDEQIRSLARTAEDGRAAGAHLLPGRERAALEATITAHEQADRRRDEHLDAAVTASTRLVAAQFGTAAHDAAALAFARQRTEYQRCRDTADASRGPAERARAYLAADDSHRRAVSGRIDAGHQAESELGTRLRIQLADAVNRTAILPSWFVAALGPGPPPGRAEPWIETAIGELAYRAAYGVADPLSALGAEDPHSHATGYRAEWRTRLAAEIRQLTS
ncbi:MAG: hypothetical protein QOD41_4007 [Cryptosporangiaceae bacterium]|nr:hypothetical protein [Cryptosporangiaceae bacterium]